MMDRTDRHFRFLMRLITRRTLLYTEMITTGAILNGDQDYLLRYHEAEHPIALQLGGDDPEALARCAEIAETYGYDEVNINVGCPSDRVQNGRFGASLMARPHDVAAAVTAMRRACSLPVTVKHRIGIDDLDRYEDMLHFVDVVADAGADRFSVHARKAWLNGLSPKENRTVPPLRYDDVHRLKADRPELVVEINGGFVDLVAAHSQLDGLDAVMVGRHAYDDPYAFSIADRLYFGDEEPPLSRAEVVSAMRPYMADTLDRGGRPLHVARHALNLFAGQPRARTWRRFISENHDKGGLGADLLDAALEAMAE